MKKEQELDPRQRMIALGIAIVIVVSGHFIYSFARKIWYKNEGRVIERMHDECVEAVDRRVKHVSSRVTEDKKAEWQNRALQECQQIKESCEKNFKQPFCLLAQKQFQDPE